MITPGSSVLDLGCAPGAWLQVACQSLGPLKSGGSVGGIDIKKVKVPSLHCDSRVQTVCTDVLNMPKPEVQKLSPQRKGFSTILSDMCPLVSGITDRDAASSAELGMRALDLAVGRAAFPHCDNSILFDKQLEDDGLVGPGGNLAIKLLESEEVKEFSKICKPLFKKFVMVETKSYKTKL